jgi:transcriptional regulator with GAF, ATPase, and Fis domain
MGRHPKFTKEELIEALKAGGGDDVKAAAILEVDPTTVLRARVRYGVQIQTERRVIAA